MTPYRRVVDVLLSQEDPVLVFVGPPCRTWFIDRRAVEDLMVDLYRIRPYSVTHAGRLPFDGIVAEVAETLGAPVNLLGPELEKRFTVSYTRDPYLVVGATLLIAFPVEDADGKKRYPSESADVEVVRMAREQEIPILVVYRDGKVVMEEKRT